MDNELKMPVDRICGEAANILQKCFWEKMTIEGKAAINNVLMCYNDGEKCDYRDQMLVAKISDSLQISNSIG